MSKSEQDNNKDVLKKVETRRIATIKQIDFLIDFLRDHEELRHSRVRSKDGVFVMRKLWDVCTEKLNKLGPTRNSKEWTKYWSDLKCRVKQKAAEISKRAGVAGERGEGAGLTLSYAERKIINLLECDRQMTHPQEVPLDCSSSGSIWEAMNYTLIKEEHDEDMQVLQDTNVEEFINFAPVLENLDPLATIPLPVDQRETRAGDGTLPGPSPQQAMPPPPPPASGAGPATQPPPANPGPYSRAPSVPPEASFTPKRRRRRTRVQEVPRPDQPCYTAQCMNCSELKEFANLMLKLEESHARTSRIQTEAQLKMTEVLKLQAEGIMHTGVALREMTNNLCRLLEGYLLTNRQITT